MFWELTVHGKPFLYFEIRNKKINISKLIIILNNYNIDINSKSIMLKPISPKEDNDINWILL